MWWGREADSQGEPMMTACPGLAGTQPELLLASRQAVRAAVAARMAGFTWDWTNAGRDDSGVALVRLFGIQMEPLLSRVNRLPEKALIEYLRIAGAAPLPATAAEALLTFTVSPAAGRSVLIPAGFQAGASPAAGNGGQVIFETGRDVMATPASVAAIAVTVAGVVSAVDPTLAPFAAFGPAPALATRCGSAWTSRREWPAPRPGCRWPWCPRPPRARRRPSRPGEYRLRRPRPPRWSAGRSWTEPA